jgi:hypothetical protein
MEGQKDHKYMSMTRRMFAPLPPSYIPEIRRQSLGKMFGFFIQETRLSAGLSVEEAARLSGMAVSEWMAVEAGQVPRDLNRLRALAEAMEISFDKIASMVLVCRGAWEL